MIELTKNAITPAEIDLVLGAALQGELTRIMAEQAQADLRSDAEIEARIAALEAEIRDLKRAARRNDFEKVQPWCATAAETLDLALPAELPVEMGRQALALRRALAELEAKVADGEEASRLAEPLVARVSTAPVETFFKTLKAELIWRHRWETRRQAETALFEYINGFYIPRRRHSALGGKSPVAFESKAA